MPRFFCILFAVLLSACTSSLTPLQGRERIADGTHEIVGIAVLPEDPVIRAGEEVKLTARAYYADQTYGDVTWDVLWEAEDERVVSLSNFGVASAWEAGESEVVASHPNGMVASVQVVVVATEAFLTDLVLSPSSLELRVGQFTQLEAIAHWSDGTSGNIAATCDWATGNRDIAHVDETGTVLGGGEGTTGILADCHGNRAEATVHVVPGDANTGLADLTVTGFQASVSGDEITYEVTVENRGDALSDGFYVDLHLDRSSAPTGTSVGDEWDYVTGIGPGQSKVVALTLSEVEAGSYRSWVIADPEDYAEESDEGNNVRGPVSVEVEEQLLGPNLEITDFQALSDGTYTLFGFTIRNTGDQVATDFWVDLFYDQEDEPDTCAYGDYYEEVVDLQPGASRTFEHEVEDGPEWWWDAWLYVDTCDDVEESEEGDNIESLEVWAE
ncbi:MAG: hypothetical protein JRJ84_02270 [Deltaproteobacteria bacterium]|nr:hypothetical protein [Deltaproteobacteria bacterium]